MYQGNVVLNACLSLWQQWMTIYFLLTQGQKSLLD